MHHLGLGYFQEIVELRQRFCDPLRSLTELKRPSSLMNRCSLTKRTKLKKGVFRTDWQKSRLQREHSTFHRKCDFHFDHLARWNQTFTEDLTTSLWMNWMRILGWFWTLFQCLVLKYKYSFPLMTWKTVNIVLVILLKYPGGLEWNCGGILGASPVLIRKIVRLLGAL